MTLHFEHSPWLWVGMIVFYLAILPKITKAPFHGCVLATIGYILPSFVMDALTVEKPSGVYLPLVFCVFVASFAAGDAIIKRFGGRPVWFRPSS